MNEKSLTININVKTFNKKEDYLNIISAINFFSFFNEVNKKYKSVDFLET